MTVPDELEYTKEHEWVRREGEVATIGITYYAQDKLGDVVYVELPDAGASVAVGETFGTVESVKAVSDLCAPISGEVTEINEGLADAPEVVNQDPYGAGWMVKLKLSGEPTDLMSAQDYSELIASS